MEYDNMVENGVTDIYGMTKKKHDEVLRACDSLKAIMTLTEPQLEFMRELCYINKGMWFDDVNALIRGEAKREIALTLDSIKKLTSKELAEHFITNGEEEWIIKIMTQLTQVQQARA